MAPPPSSSSPTNIFRRMIRPAALAGVYRHSVAWFLAALILMFVAVPFLEDLPNGELLTSLATTVTLIAAVLAVGGRRRSLTVAGVLASPVLVSRWLQHHRSLGIEYHIFMLAALAFLTFVLVQFLRFILRAPRVDSEVLCAGVATYLLLSVWWTVAYSITSRLVPGSFSSQSAGVQELNGFESLYFSLVTLTTVGYGDIAPVSRPARLLAMVEALTGTLYIAVLVARLVSQNASLTSTHPVSRPPDDHRTLPPSP